VTSRSISRFVPVTTHPEAESERHYREVHFPFAQRLLRDLPHVRSYHTDRVVRERDIAGGWAAKPTAWRYVLLRFDEGRSLELDAITADTIANDHPNCLRDLRTTTVADEVVVDRLHGQTVLDKYLIEVDRPDPVPHERAAVAFDRLVAVLEATCGAAFGTRLLRVNRVLTEYGTEPVVEPGQRGTGRALPVTTKVGFVELYVDDRRWGDPLFDVTGVAEALADPHLDRPRVRQVVERCGLDRS
jgi:hypothetical protein